MKIVKIKKKGKARPKKYFEIHIKKCSYLWFIRFMVKLILKPHYLFAFFIWWFFVLAALGSYVTQIYIYSQILMQVKWGSLTTCLCYCYIVPCFETFYLNVWKVPPTSILILMHNLQHLRLRPQLRLRLRLRTLLRYYASFFS